MLLLTLWDLLAGSCKGLVQVPFGALRQAEAAAVGLCAWKVGAAGNVGRNWQDRREVALGALWRQ